MIKEIKKEAKEIVHKNIVNFIELEAFALIFLIVFSILTFFTGTLFLIGPFLVGISYVYMKVVRDNEFDLRNFFYGFENKNVVANVFTEFLKNIFILAWTILFIVPGIIKSLSYAMTPYILADDNKIKTRSALRKGKLMMTGYKMELFKLNLSFIGWWFLVFLTLGLALFYVSAYYRVATFLFYEKIKGNFEEEENKEEEAEVQLQDKKEVRQEKKNKKKKEQKGKKEKVKEKKVKEKKTKVKPPKERKRKEKKTKDKKKRKEKKTKRGVKDAESR
ncbi:MAG TPA: DUF975 family protein [Tenericutes bacterium]|nr:DUF975 family protein [Mycoplasmatota bacterium]